MVTDLMGIGLVVVISAAIWFMLRVLDVVEAEGYLRAPVRAGRSRARAVRAGLQRSTKAVTSRLLK